MADVIKKATRESYAEALKTLAQINDKVIVLDADQAGATKSAAFKKACPERLLTQQEHAHSDGASPIRCHQ